MDIFVKMTETMINFKAFPTTRYQGSKRKILYWIYECIKELKFNQVLDAFGGSASFSYLAKKMGKSVIYNDLMRFNYFIGKSLIENQKVTVTEEEISYILTNKTLNKNYNVIENNFQDIYFLDHENVWLDNTISNIHSLAGIGEDVEFKQAIFFNALFQSSLAKRPFNLFHRKNLYIRTADVERNFGNKTTWEKSFEDHLLTFTNQINDSVFNNNQFCKSTNQSVFDLDFIEADCVYLDPPYYKSKGGSETSNYFRCYHFLEGISHYNRWESMINYEAVNKGFKADKVSEHFDKQDIGDSFEQLFKKFNDKTIILSYKSGGNPSIDWLENVLKKMGKNVSIHVTNYSYALNRDSKKGTPTIEALLVAK
jgi:adenine-specific DNA-methyltransferase